MASRVPVNPSRDFSFRLVFVAFYSGRDFAELRDTHQLASRLVVALSRNCGYFRAASVSRGDPVWVADLVVVETRGLEPLTPCLQSRCSTN